MKGAARSADWNAGRWGLALAVLTVTGIIIYVRMWRPNLKGIERVFG